MKIFEKLKSYSSFNYMPCFYCNVDSQELKFFLLIIIGGLVGSSIFFAIGLYLKGVFKNTEKLNSRPMELEE